ncbi:DNA polymerase IV [Subtercola boreus]|uniref:DNA polymerase IV n=1 Tax=Subtercola boreus TaxID=120213 RepID=A0A3E0VNY3_9MICO|nr:DNA polymerase IV [Subtercola boreus]RFA11113.1 DNA polymerase IV [Subtercola boreus]TQL54277.1 DNA polymerase-4 [Subtercola boreus]
MPSAGERIFGGGADDGTSTMLHIDMDAFFASVELLEHPELRGLPVIIGGAGGRGVVTSATYEARRFGVHSAMPTARALQLCPKAIVLPSHHEKYRHYSAQVMNVFRDVTPLVEPLSIDEAFLDVAGARRLLGSPSTIGAAVRARVFAETGLTCSVGAASTKFIAKMASGRAKPDGMLVVPASESLAFLHPLPVGALWGVGASTAEALTRLGIRTVGDLAATPLQTLVSRVGEASGQKLHSLANGHDRRSVVTERVEKSIGHEMTFEFDMSDPRQLRLELLRLSDQVAVRLRRAGLAAKTVALKVRFSDFSTISRSRTLSEPTDLAQTISDAARDLFDHVGLEQRVRLIGVRAENLVEAHETVHQPSLWEDESAAPSSWRDAEVTVDRVAEKFGRNILKRASLVEPGPRERRRPDHPAPPA